MSVILLCAHNDNATDVIASWVRGAFDSYINCTQQPATSNSFVCSIYLHNLPATSPVSKIISMKYITATLLLSIRAFARSQSVSGVFSLFFQLKILLISITMSWRPSQRLWSIKIYSCTSVGVCDIGFSNQTYVHQLHTLSNRIMHAFASLNLNCSVFDRWLHVGVCDRMLKSDATRSNSVSQLKFSHLYATFCSFCCWSQVWAKIITEYLSIKSNQMNWIRIKAIFKSKLF